MTTLSADAVAALASSLLALGLFVAVITAGTRLKHFHSDNLAHLGANDRLTGQGKLSKHFTKSCPANYHAEHYEVILDASAGICSSGTGSAILALVS